MNPSNHFTTTVVHQHPRLPARMTHIMTPHGMAVTPTFMPVGTRAGVNCLLPEDLRKSNSQIILGGNTYHMLVAPGMDVIRQAGGMHDFMAWQGPMLTDSGGFQLFSLSKRNQMCVIDDLGAHFTHPRTQDVIHMTPEISIQTQKIIGADIIMAFDQCTSDEATREETLLAMERTHRWLRQSVDEHQRDPNSAYGHRQALFGIIQGGEFRDLREKSLEFIVEMGLDGIAIGGAVIGFDMQKTREILSWLIPQLPAAKTRYTMGVGLAPQDLIDVVAAGVDIFDCVAPTRNARHGSLYCGEIVDTGDWIEFVPLVEQGRLQIKKREYARDETSIMPSCTCWTCQHYSRADLHYLLREQAIAFASLASLHNVSVMQQVCLRMQEKIRTTSVTGGSVDKTINSFPD